MNESLEQIIYDAWRDSEAYQVPMTEEGAKLAEIRFYIFKLGWKYCEFYAKRGHVYIKDHEEEN